MNMQLLINILGRDAAPIGAILINKRYIIVTQTSITNVQSTQYKLLEKNIKRVQTKNVKLLKYDKNLREELSSINSKNKQGQQRNEQQNIWSLSINCLITFEDSFIQNYCNCLKLIKLNDRKDFKDKIAEIKKILIKKLKKLMKKRHKIL